MDEQMDQTMAKTVVAPHESGMVDEAQTPIALPKVNKQQTTVTKSCLDRMESVKMSSLYRTKLTSRVSTKDAKQALKIKQAQEAKDPVVMKKNGPLDGIERAKHEMNQKKLMRVYTMLNTWESILPPPKIIHKRLMTLTPKEVAPEASANPERLSHGRLNVKHVSMVDPTTSPEENINKTINSSQERRIFTKQEYRRCFVTNFPSSSSSSLCSLL